jgi:Flp pilus assembly protein TadB
MPNEGNIFKQYTKYLARSKWIIIPCGVIIVICYFIAHINPLAAVISAVLLSLTIAGWYFERKDSKSNKVVKRNS